MICEVRLTRQLEIEGAHAKGVEHLCVAYVFAWRYCPRGQAKGQLPREQGVALRDRRYRETVSLHYGIVQGQDSSAKCDMRARRECTRGDCDVVAGQRQAGYLIER